MSVSGDGTQAVVALSDGTFGLRDVRQIRQGDEVDPKVAGVTLVGPPAWKDGTPKTLVWVHLAECGSWKGHPAGAFSMTPATFSEIVRNFERRALPVPFDWEHASEQEPTAGSVPLTGTPAPAWVHKLDNRGIGGLWGLVEWFDYARQSIKEGTYAFLSPAIRFGCKDPETNQQIGARLTSVALTNQPFLTHLEELRAAKDSPVRATMMSAVRFDMSEAVGTTVAMGLDRTLRQPHEYMPQLKAALKMGPLCSSMECSDELTRLRSCCEMADANGFHEGTNLHDYMHPLADIVGMTGPHHQWGAILDVVDEMIDAAMEQHIQQDHGGQTDMADRPSPETPEIPEMDANAIALKDAAITAATGQVTLLTSKVTELTTRADTAEAAVSKVTLQLKDVTARADTAEATVKTVTAALALKDGETLDKAIARIVAENSTLLADKVKRDEADLQADVEVAIATYKDTKGISDADKPHLMKLAKLDHESFNALYPPVSPEQRHLLRSIVPVEKRPDPKDAGAKSFSARTKRIMADRKCSLAEAQIAASQELA